MDEPYGRLDIRDATANYFLARADPVCVLLSCFKTAHVRVCRKPKASGKPKAKAVRQAEAGGEGEAKTKRLSKPQLTAIAKAHASTRSPADPCIAQSRYTRVDIGRSHLLGVDISGESGRMSTTSKW